VDPSRARLVRSRGAPRNRRSRSAPRAAALVAALLLSGCVIETVHLPDRTRGEQGMLAQAVERAGREIPIDLLRTERVQLRVAALAPDVAGYVESSLRRRLIEQGVEVTSDPERLPPSRIVHLLVGTAAAETRTKSVELPFPIPLLTKPLGLSIYERSVERGDVQVSGYVTDASTSRLLSEFGPIGAWASSREVTIFSFLGPFRSSDEDARPRPPPGPGD